MQHCGWWKPSCHCKLMVSKSQRFHFRALAFWTLRQTRALCPLLHHRGLKHPIQPGSCQSAHPSWPLWCLFHRALPRHGWRRLPTDETRVYPNEFLNLAATYESKSLFLGEMCHCCEWWCISAKGHRAYVDVFTWLKSCFFSVPKQAVMYLKIFTGNWSKTNFLEVLESTWAQSCVSPTE